MLDEVNPGSWFKTTYRNTKEGKSNSKGDGGGYGIVLFTGAAAIVSTTGGLPRRKLPDPDVGPSKVNRAIGGIRSVRVEGC